MVQPRDMKFKKPAVEEEEEEEMIDEELARTMPYEDGDEVAAPTKRSTIQQQPQPPKKPTLTVAPGRQSNYEMEDDHDALPPPPPHVHFAQNAWPSYSNVPAQPAMPAPQPAPVRQAQAKAVNKAEEDIFISGMLVGAVVATAVSGAVYLLFFRGSPASATAAVARPAAAAPTGSQLKSIYRRV